MLSIIYVEEVVVYRCYDAAGELLYVGCTSGLRNRVRLHRSRSPWWPTVHRLEVGPVMDKRLGLDWERWHIMALAPLHNKTANRRRGWGYRSRRDGFDRPSGLTYFPERDEFREPVAA